MFFSLILATLNRPKEVQLCIDSIIKQSFKDYEVIIIDQSKTSETEDIINSYANCCDIVYIREKIKGLSHARNVGIEKSRGKYVCLIDDDAIYPEDYLKKVYSIVMDEKKCIVGGQIIDPMTGALKSNKSSREIKYYSVFDCLMSPSMVIQKSFVALNRFDERLGVGCFLGSGEESDLVFCAISQGRKVVYDTSYYAYHHIESSDEVNINKIVSYGRGLGGLCRKIITRYSFFWGMAYVLKTIVGNTVLSVLYLFGDPQKSLARRRKVAGFIEGFFKY